MKTTFGILRHNWWRTRDLREWVWDAAAVVSIFGNLIIAAAIYAAFVGDKS